MSVLGALVSHDKLFNLSSAVLSAVVTPVAMAMLWILLLSLDAKLKHKLGIRQNADNGQAIQLAVTMYLYMYLVKFWPYSVSLLHHATTCSCSVVLQNEGQKWTNSCTREKSLKQVVILGVEWLSYPFSITLICIVSVDAEHFACQVHMYEACRASCFSAMLSWWYLIGFYSFVSPMVRILIKIMPIHMHTQDPLPN